MKPENFAWVGFTEEQERTLNLLDFIGNNGWARNSQTEVMMVPLLSEAEERGLTFAQVRQAMEAIGYGRHALHELDRWNRKRTTGKFGR